MNDILELMWSPEDVYPDYDERERWTPWLPPGGTAVCKPPTEPRVGVACIPPGIYYMDSCFY